MDADLQALFWFVCGAAALLFGNAKRNKHQRLEEQGLKATGVVTRATYGSWLILFGWNVQQYTTRFTTADNRQITKDHFRLLAHHEGHLHDEHYYEEHDDNEHYREAETVDILYNFNEPEEFVVNSGRSLGPKFLMLAGTGAIGYSFWLIFQQL